MTSVWEGLASWFASANVYGSYLLIAILVPTGLYFTLRFRFLQFRRFFTSIAITSGKYDDDKDPGDVSHFQALTTALSATVGIGNIVGVALAIYYGGPGAIFWMWVTGFLGMMNKFAECTLGIKYRKILRDGTVSGGPMYYIEHGLKKYVGSRFAKGMGVFFAAGCALTSFGMGNMAQSNSAATALEESYSVSPWLSGGIIATIVFLVIVGGIRRIGRVTSRLVPIMAALYVGTALAILIANVTELVPALALIVRSAFTPTAAVGGFIGSTLLMTVRYGIARGLFSNEAGLGSASIAHAAAKTEWPVREGLVASLEPFVDTLLICTMTALVILITGTWDSGLLGASMTIQSFEVGLAPLGLGYLGRHLVTICTILFAISTAISWSYYGDRSVQYLFGLRWVLPYRVLYCVIYLMGAVWAVELVWNFSDFALIWMAIPNLLAMLFLSGELWRDTKEYFLRGHPQKGR